MTEKKKHFVSLSVKPLFVLLLGLVLGVCVCLLANFTGEQIIERSYMSDKAVLKRTNRAAQEFQSFVRQNSISTRDTDMLARWGETKKDYYIMLYHDQRQILEIGWWGADSAAVDAYSLKEQMASVVYPIVFRDGTFYAVIYDNSDSGLYDLLWIVSLLLGCAVLALTLLAYNRRIARRVVAISQEVQSIGAGNLYLQLEPKGRDEISQLTASVEQMRLSLLRKTSEEQRALQQNSDLITAMSHDIRNPLTALLGYLDLAKNGQYRSEDELQSYLIHRIEKFLNNHGRRLLGWDEILQGGIAPNATVMSWRGEEGGIAAVTSGHHAIMTPGAYCYLDSYQDAPYSQPEAIGGYLPLKKVYAYDPVPASLTAEQAKLVYGVQGNLWVEYIPTPEHVEYMIYPRMLALAEVAWSAPERKSWSDFHTRALSAVADLQKKGYHPFDLSKEIGSRPESLQPVSHLALGKKVTYNSSYSPHYPAQGNTALTDGIRGDWTYGDGSWQGFISDNRLDVTIDMEKETPIHSVTAAFMQVVGAEVFLPETVIISISDDGINFTELQKQHFEVSKETPIRFTDISWQGEAKGRYVRYQAQAGSEFGGWIFTDEIIVK